jgi:hypothetical protein
MTIRSRDSSVQDGRPGFESRRGRIAFSQFHNVQTEPEAHPASYSEGTGDFSLGDKAAGT